jgi:hypothetical protein
MAADQGILDSVTNSNTKVLGDQVSAIMAASLQGMIDSQNRCRIIAETAMAKAIDNLNTVDVGEGLGIAAAQRGDLAKQISDLAAAVSGIQAYIKGGQTVPPVTP